MSSDERLEDRALPAVLGAQTLFVALGSLVTLVIGFPLQVYVSRVLGSTGVGVYGLLEGLMATAAGLLSFGVSQTVVRFIPEHLAQGQFGRAKTLIRLSCGVLLGLGLAGAAACFLVTDWIVGRWPETAAHRTAILLMSAMIPLTLLLTLFQQALRGFQDVRYMVTGTSFVQLPMKAALTVALLAMGYQLGGYILATVLATLTGCAWLFLGVYRKTAALPDSRAEADVISAWRRYASVSYANSLVSIAAANIDRFLLAALFGPGAVGVVLIVRQLQQLPVVFNQMLLMVGAPMFAAAHGRNDPAERQHLFTLMTDWVMRASLPLLIFLAVFAEPLLGLYGPDFAAKGRTALWIMVVGQLINLASGPNGNLAMMSGLERQAIKLFVITGFIAAGLLAVLTPLLGLTGAALAAALSNVITNLSCLRLIRRELGVRWWDRRYLAWAAPSAMAAGCAIAALLFVPGMDEAWKLGGALVGVYAAFAGVNLVQGLHADDMDFLRHMLALVRTPRSAG